MHFCDRKPLSWESPLGDPQPFVQPHAGIPVMMTTTEMFTQRLLTPYIFYITKAIRKNRMSDSGESARIIVLWVHSLNERETYDKEPHNL
jgi:hypothetical protein